MSKTSKTARLNILTSFIYYAFTIVLGLLIPRITLVNYGSATNGLITSAIQFVSYLIIFEAGLQAVAMQALYRTVAINSYKKTNEILSAVNKNYKRIGVYYLIGLIIVSALFPLIISEESVPYTTAFLVAFFSGLSNVVSFFLQGKYRILLLVEGKNYFLNILNIITTILNHGIRLFLLFLKVDISIVVFGSFIASMFPVIVIMIYTKKHYEWINLKENPNYSVLSQSKDALIHQLSWLVFTNIDVVLLTFFFDLKIVSVYAVYRMVFEYVLTFSKIPFDSISFKLGQVYNSSKKDFNKIYDGVEIISSTISFSLFTVAFCLVIPFVSLYTKGVVDIQYVDYRLATLFVLSEILTFMRYPMLNVINYSGHFKQTSLQTIIETTLNLVFSIIGVAFFGIYGVLLGTVISLLYRTFDIIIYGNSKLLNRNSFFTITIYLIEFIIFVFIYAVFELLNIHIKSYFEFAFAGLIVTAIVFIIYFLIILLIYPRQLSHLKAFLKKH